MVHLTEGHAETDLCRISELLRRRRGLDLNGYRSRCITRRIWTRVRALRLEGLAAYAHHLAGHPEETDCLLAAITINVTDFFRNASHFQALARNVLPSLLEARRGRPVRIWCAGCATGEEVYSLALLARRVAPERIRPVMITGTDLDGRALDVARKGRYPLARLQQVPEKERLAWFVPDGDALCVGRGLKRLCRFQEANLLRDPAPGPADLVVCRNVLIYLDPKQQAHVLEVFHRALSPGGYLALGAVERAAGQALIWFHPVDSRERIYRHGAVA